MNDLSRLICMERTTVTENHVQILCTSTLQPEKEIMKIPYETIDSLQAKTITIVSSQKKRLLKLFVSRFPD